MRGRRGRRRRAGKRAREPGCRAVMRATSVGRRGRGRPSSGRCRPASAAAAVRSTAAFRSSQAAEFSADRCGEGGAAVLDDLRFSDDGRGGCRCERHDASFRPSRLRRALDELLCARRRKVAWMHDSCTVLHFRHGRPQTDVRAALAEYADPAMPSTCSDSSRPGRASTARATSSSACGCPQRARW